MLQEMAIQEMSAYLMASVKTAEGLVRGKRRQHSGGIPVPTKIGRVGIV